MTVKSWWRSARSLVFSPGPSAVVDGDLNRDRVTVQDVAPSRSARFEQQYLRRGCPPTGFLSPTRPRRGVSISSPASPTGLARGGCVSIGASFACILGVEATARSRGGGWPDDDPIARVRSRVKGKLLHEGVQAIPCGRPACARPRHARGGAGRAARGSTRRRWSSSRRRSGRSWPTTATTATRPTPTPRAACGSTTATACSRAATAARPSCPGKPEKSLLIQAVAPRRRRPEDAAEEAALDGADRRPDAVDQGRRGLAGGRACPSSVGKPNAEVRAAPQGALGLAAAARAEAPRGAGRRRGRATTSTASSWPSWRRRACSRSATPTGRR